MFFLIQTTAFYKLGKVVGRHKFWLTIYPGIDQILIIALLVVFLMEYISTRVRYKYDRENEISSSGKIIWHGMTIHQSMNGRTKTWEGNFLSNRHDLDSYQVWNGKIDFSFWCSLIVSALVLSRTKSGEKIHIFMKSANERY